jgi:hypothetical protein
MGRILKQAVMAKSWHYPRICLKELRKTIKELMIDHVLAKIQINRLLDTSLEVSKHKKINQEPDYLYKNQHLIKK